MRRAIATKRQEKVVTVETVQGDPLLPIPDGFDRNRLEKAKIRIVRHRSYLTLRRTAAVPMVPNNCPTDRGNSHPTETGAGCLNALGQSSDH